MEVKALADETCEEAEATVKDNRERPEKIADALEREETLEGDALGKVLGARPKKENPS
jgi:ATP-dependent Zn protease